MNNCRKIDKYLRDSDGSTRDITFTPIPPEDLFNFLAKFFSEFSDISISDKDGNEVEANLPKVIDALSSDSGFIHGVLKSESFMVSPFQIFIDWENPHCFRVELSYFPQDIITERFSVSTFLKKVISWWDLLRADEVFIRYENASWKWYDKQGLGVFFYKKREA